MITLIFYFLKNIYSLYLIFVWAFRTCFTKCGIGYKATNSDGNAHVTGASTSSRLFLTLDIA